MANTFMSGSSDLLVFEASWATSISGWKKTCYHISVYILVSPWRSCYHAGESLTKQETASRHFLRQMTKMPSNSRSSKKFLLEFLWATTTVRRCGSLKQARACSSSSTITALVHPHFEPLKLSRWLPSLDGQWGNTTIAECAFEEWLPGCPCYAQDCKR